MNQIMLTLGLSLILQNLALVLFSADPLIAQTAYSRITFSIGPAVVRVPQLIAFGGSGLAAVLLYWFLQKTDAGRAIRAASQNREAAVLMGIDVQRTYMLAFGIGSACLGVAASLMVPFFYTSPTVGLWFGQVAFIVVVLGGMGNFMGALVGGQIIGLTEAFGAAILPGTLSRVFTFAIFILVLLFRPRVIWREQEMSKYTIAFLSILLVILFLLPLVAGEYLLHMVVLVLLYAYLAIAWNILAATQASIR